MMSSFYGGFLRSYSELPCGTVLMCSGVMCVVYNQEYHMMSVRRRLRSLKKKTFSVKDGFEL